MNSLNIVEQALNLKKYDVITECVKIEFGNDKNLVLSEYCGDGVRLHKDGNTVKVLCPKNMTVTESSYLAEEISRGTIFDKADEIENNAEYIEKSVLPVNAIVNSGCETPKHIKPMLAIIIGKMDENGSFNVDGVKQINGLSFIKDILSCKDKGFKPRDIINDYLGNKEEDMSNEDIKKNVIGVGKDLKEIENVDTDLSINDEDDVDENLTKEKIKDAEVDHSDEDEAEEELEEMEDVEECGDCEDCTMESYIFQESLFLSINNVKQKLVKVISPVQSDMLSITAAFDDGRLSKSKLVKMYKSKTGALKHKLEGNKDKDKGHGYDISTPAMKNLSNLNSIIDKIIRKPKIQKAFKASELGAINNISENLDSYIDMIESVVYDNSSDNEVLVDRIADTSLKTLNLFKTTIDFCSNTHQSDADDPENPSNEPDDESIEASAEENAVKEIVENEEEKETKEAEEVEPEMGDDEPVVPDKEDKEKDDKKKDEEIEEAARIIGLNSDGSFKREGAGDLPPQPTTMEYNTSETVPRCLTKQESIDFNNHIKSIESNNAGEYNEGFLTKKPKKLKPIPRDIIPYITIEMNAIKDSNDQAMLAGYTTNKIDLVDFYLTILDTQDPRYIVPHNRIYLENMRRDLDSLLIQILRIRPINRSDRVWRVNYPAEGGIR